MMKTVALPSGERVPALGMGTWYMGDSAARRSDEIAALKYGLDLGIRLIDTAEMYGDGGAEEVVAAAIAGRRDEVFVVSKVYPHNAGRRGAVTACERSLKRLGTDRLDLYLLHWRGSVPFDETLAAFVKLQAQGKIRHFGVSNLDLADMQELSKLDGAGDIQTNQLLYNLSRRGIEADLLPWLRERRVPVMAYSPIEQGRLARDGKLRAFAERRGITAAQAALAWLLRADDVIVIPKSARPERIEENVKTLHIRLSESDLAELDRLFPPPSKPRPLEML
jgi:diketogulonate reductase-like aldo/keto reductase